MKTSWKILSRPVVNLAMAGLTALTINGCTRQDVAMRTAVTNETTTTVRPLALVLSPHAGEGRLDEQIRRRQDDVRSNRNAHAALERLGWLYVGKARESFDAGYYTLAEQCSLALDLLKPNCPEALLLRGHALHSQHRFLEAAALARQLVSARGLASDHGLLGDILVDVGRVEEAERAYQAMLDLKPDPQGCARAAHLRWLKGDLEGAVEIMRVAAAGASPRDAESAAWMHTQLARYLWPSGANVEAQEAIESALAFRANYPPALLLRGRLLLAEDRAEAAIDPLQQAACLNPLPEHQWVLAEALRAAGRESEARAVEQEILRNGPRGDPRTCALFLATRQEQPELAVRLARGELAERQDVFSHDALAWALAASGQLAEAASHAQQALALGTREARLWLHAGVIAAKSGKRAAAAEWLRKADERRAQLLPAERAHLRSAQEAVEAAAGASPGMSFHEPEAPGSRSARCRTPRSSRAGAWRSDLGSRAQGAHLFGAFSPRDNPTLFSRGRPRPGREKLRPTKQRQKDKE
jgi:tetratricopeptide (TPR) repeat protein